MYNSKSTSRKTCWNKGKLVGQKLPLKLEEIWSIRIRLELANNLRELTMFNLALDCKLRACDFIKLKVLDIAHGATIQSRAMLIQQKTGSSVQFELTPKTRKSLQEWIAQKSLRSGDYLFGSSRYEYVAKIIHVKEHMISDSSAGQLSYL
jgi:integrase